MKRLIATTITLSVLGIGAVLAADNQLKVQDLPAAVQKTVKEQTKNATLVGLIKEVENGKTVYELETKVNGLARDLMIGAAGAILSVEEEVTLDGIPAGARAAIQKQAARGKITKVEILTEGKTVSYEAVVVKNGKTSEIAVKANGSAVK
jgi:uncharacterized membrane protein YkoI